MTGLTGFDRHQVMAGVVLRPLSDKGLRRPYGLAWLALQERLPRPLLDERLPCPLLDERPPRHPGLAWLALVCSPKVGPRLLPQRRETKGIRSLTHCSLALAKAPVHADLVHYIILYYIILYFM
jgi:hypothetical protein